MAAHVSGTGSGAFFTEQITALKQRLEGDESPRGRELLVEARRLAALFEAWMTDRPDPEAKANAIRELVDLNRAVHEHSGVTSGLRPNPVHALERSDGSAEATSYTPTSSKR